MEKELTLLKLTLIEKENPLLSETETCFLRLNVIKANTDNKIKRLEKLKNNWQNLILKETETAKKLESIQLDITRMREIKQNSDLPTLQGHLLELKVIISLFEFLFCQMFIIFEV